MKIQFLQRLVGSVNKIEPLINLFYLICADHCCFFFHHFAVFSKNVRNCHHKFDQTQLLNINCRRQFSIHYVSYTVHFLVIVEFTHWNKKQQSSTHMIHDQCHHLRCKHTFKLCANALKTYFLYFFNVNKLLYWNCGYSFLWLAHICYALGLKEETDLPLLSIFIPIHFVDQVKSGVVRSG